MIEKHDSVWWGTFSVEEDTANCWRVGALTVWIERRREEWRISHASTDDPFETAVEITTPAEEILPEGDVTLHRFAAKRTENGLKITPVLPDRPLVSRPDTPFHVLAGDDVLVYVSSPVWMKIEAGAPPRSLLELPIYRSSDTWFGPNTREGELCYASRTACRQDHDDLPRRPHRAVTPLRIRNRTEATLLIERLNVPVPNLSLYATSRGALWTQTVTVEIEREGGTAELRTGTKAPSEAQGATLVSGPREEQDTNIFTRALGALIG
jgi:hypothetical protein